MQASQSARETQPQQGKTTTFRLYAGASTIVLIALLAALYAAWHLRQEMEARLNGGTQHLARALEGTFDGLIDTLDVALQAAADEIEHQQAGGTPDPQEITALLSRQQQRVPHVAFLRATDEFGQVIYGLDAPSTKASMADREFFVHLRDDASLGLYVAKPVVGRIDKRLLWTFARRIKRADGGFGGTVYASIALADLEQMLAQIKMAPGGSIALRDRDLGLMARQTFGHDNPIALGTRLLSEPALQAMRLKPEEGSYISDGSSLDALSRSYSYRRSQKYGYLVNVGLAREQELGHWRTQALILGALVAALAFALFKLVRQMNLTMRQQNEFIASMQAKEAALRAEHQALMDAEAQHLNLLRKLDAGIVVHAPDTRILFSNARAAEILGLSDEQMQGRMAIDPAWCFLDLAGVILRPEQYPVSLVIQTGEPLRDMEFAIKKPSQQSLTWVSVSAFADLDAQGRIDKVVVNFYDISARKAAEFVWRFAFESAGDGVWDLNLETEEAHYSQRYQEMLGYVDGEFPRTHQAWMELIHPDDKPRLLQIIDDYLQRRSEAYAAEYRLRCKNGDYKWIYARGSVVSRSAEGQPLRMVGTHTDISALKAVEEKIWLQANYDGLTHLPNRQLFHDRLEQLIKKAQRDQERVAVLFIDLDHFKEVNDTLGHDVGDELLEEAALRIKDSVRDCDTVARLGGDEFTVLLPELHDLAVIGALAQKIIERVSLPYLLRGAELHVSASIGIAIYPDDATTVIDLTKNADQAMYVAKGQGRHCFRFFTRAMQDDALLHMVLASDLRHALGAGQLTLHYQPIVDLAGGSVRKAEALLRWLHPTRGQIPPSQFIPIAEETGLINPIGAWVMRQAIAQVVDWKQRLGVELQISVNKSPVQFLADQHQQEDWLILLEQLGLSGSDIVVEITEGVLMDNDMRVAARLLEYRDLGVQVAIDDFGTGYSSLSYLKKLDVDFLKIDQSFTRNLAPDSHDLSLCEAIVVMAHKLGIQVIAEGVETEAQRDLLRQINCDFAQGYLFAKALPALEFEQLFLQPAPAR
ncbi:EAL domain-containing protein [Paucibacter sp. TC2R-5]|uniref:bifunctional diguanylate cyclase/phosphodiesterase n=1 Tax=Paucibacter sp. TC2R-5 TaxID=2893555 RepID=UPI0021E3D29C|nr:EAL domain-containing protein [Paucibacter sp. TC2R-5]MCV2358481.1 EAL domain-containing protein [Paucibacter sp. TC2R-5]